MISTIVTPGTYSSPAGLNPSLYTADAFLNQLMAMNLPDLNSEFNAHIQEIHSYPYVDQDFFNKIADTSASNFSIWTAYITNNAPSFSNLFHRAFPMYMANRYGSTSIFSILNSVVNQLFTASYLSYIKYYITAFSEQPLALKQAWYQYLFDNGTITNFFKTGAWHDAADGFLGQVKWLSWLLLTAAGRTMMIAEVKTHWVNNNLDELAVFYQVIVTIFMQDIPNVIRDTMDATERRAYSTWNTANPTTIAYLQSLIPDNTLITYYNNAKNHSELCESLQKAAFLIVAPFLPTVALPPLLADLNEFLSDDPIAMRKLCANYYPMLQYYFLQDITARKSLSFLMTKANQNSFLVYDELLASCESKQILRIFDLARNVDDTFSVADICNYLEDFLNQLLEGIIYISPSDQITYTSEIVRAKKTLQAMLSALLENSDPIAEVFQLYGRSKLSLFLDFIHTYADSIPVQENFESTFMMLLLNEKTDSELSSLLQPYLLDQSTNLWQMISLSSVFKARILSIPSFSHLI